MIGRIRGILVEKAPGQALVECAGLGYEVDIPYTTFFHLPETGDEVTLHTHFAVREDAQSLYGFASSLDRDLFRLLIKVNGVGPKLAVGILSGLDAQQFIRCVENRDSASLVKLPGVGKKTAERLLIEMADRIVQLEGQFVPTSPETTGVVQPGGQGPAGGPAATEEAEAALIALGYKPQEAAKAISKVAEEGMTSETLIRLALRNMIPA
ncbi:MULTISPECIES: Holliday junction branch migration protein RuvA [Marinobacter]|uniref:Holliday junction branch migration protein RuvA n=1 Tax=Marinobacter TaxID=2742 RepID=UPI0007D931EF|nr:MULTISPECIES: Holliday junction branch migration protein RuvA [Marinobacter]MBL3825453.1 Holliday junction branch migration protein RuvA [Marinobacter sp. MC3]MBL3893959.1 Holliday junction branch migration protein RuvA [Marinobacter sp. MW3]MCD1648402.1 Holliday junction branch migration protein RuvA [Marinobacter adhaerens]OAN87779.1 Holliday junction DNA helicase RuvA [Marinobacter sp. EhN04]OAN96538.1 Holliday junction DNA helicase RuvA [Marinobacter sp. EhC06]